MNLFAETIRSSTPFVISILSLLGTVLVVILVQVAKAMYRNADKSMVVMVWKMMLFGDREYKLKVKIENTTSRITHLNHISLVTFVDKKVVVISTLKAMPIEPSAVGNTADFIDGNPRVGYSLRIRPYGKHQVVLDFKLEDGVNIDKTTEVYFYYINKRGKKRVARIDLFTDRGQVLHFRNQK